MAISELVPALQADEAALKMPAKVVVIVDSDLGFAFWLAHSFATTEYTALPARTPSDALKLLAELDLSVDLLILHVGFPDAASLIATLRLANDGLKVIAVVEPGEECAMIDDVFAVRFKLPAGEEVSAREWLRLPSSLLDNTVIH